MTVPTAPAGYRLAEPGCWTALVERAAGLRLLGLAGAPAAGKSTLAAALVAAIPGAALVPMDGFHLPTARLAELGLVAERGTPRTFDAAGYLRLLAELRGGKGTRAPAFDRSREEPVPGAITVPAGAAPVVTEGNYLLLPSPPWDAVAGLLDEVWFVEVPEPLRVERLIARHVAYGRPPEQARARAVSGSDAANAELVAASRARATCVVDLQGWGG